MPRIRYVDRNCPFYYEEKCGLEYTISKCTANRLHNDSCIDCPLYQFTDKHTDVDKMRDYFKEIF